MKVLFDQGTPAPLRHALAGHSVRTAFEMGWSEFGNGVFVTIDKNLRYQQNFAQRRIAILVLPAARLAYPSTAPNPDFSSAK